MTDLERVKKALALFEGIAVPHWDTAREMAAARKDVDAHLKEDAEREAELVKLRKENERLTKLTDYLRNGEVNIDEQERIWNEAQAELARLRETVVHAQAVALAWGDGDNDKMQAALLSLFLHVYGQAPRAISELRSSKGQTKLDELLAALRAAEKELASGDPATALRRMQRAIAEVEGEK